MAIGLLMAGGAIMGALQGHSQAKAQHALAMANYNQQLMQGWLSTDQQNFAAAINNANREQANLLAIKASQERAGKLKAGSKRAFQESLKNLTYATSTNKATVASQLAARNSRGGSADAVNRQIKENNRRQYQELALQRNLTDRRFDEEADNVARGLDFSRQDASFFVPGTQPTDNSMSALVSGAMQGAQSMLSLANGYNQATSGTNSGGP